MSDKAGQREMAIILGEMRSLFKELFTRIENLETSLHSMAEIIGESSQSPNEEILQMLEDLGWLNGEIHTAVSPAEALPRPLLDRPISHKFMENYPDRAADPTGHEKLAELKNRVKNAKTTTLRELKNQLEIGKGKKLSATEGYYNRKALAVVSEALKTKNPTATR